MPHYLYRLIPPRPNFFATTSEAEGATMKRHWAYLQAQFAAGRIVLAGRCTDGAYGLVIVDTPSVAEARTLMEGAPAVAEGIMRPDVHEFVLTLQRPATL